MTSPLSDAGSGYQYHLLRGAIERFSQNLGQLDGSQIAEVRLQADKTYALESLVLGSQEAGEVAISTREVDDAVMQVRLRYSDRCQFLADLEANGLTEGALRQALHRELLFDGVMERVAARSGVVGELDTRHYYERNAHRFQVPERRRARHILVTINEDIEENRRDAARRRIEEIAAKLRIDPTRFADQAHLHSECPSALRGGEIGSVQRGQLHPSLEQALFRMGSRDVSDVIETEIGFHLLLLEETKPSRTIPFAVAESRIKQLLEERGRRRCQKAFIEKLEARCNRMTSR